MGDMFGDSLGYRNKSCLKKNKTSNTPQKTRKLEKDKCREPQPQVTARAAALLSHNCKVNG